MLHVTTRDVCGGGELGQFPTHIESITAIETLSVL